MKYLLLVPVVAAAGALAKHHHRSLAHNAPVELPRRSAPLAARESCPGATVTACSDKDLTPENWKKFDIDGYLTQFITTYGVHDNFPGYFASQQTAPDHPFLNFTCIDMDTNGCVHAQPDADFQSSDCVFQGIRDVRNTPCSHYLSPQAAFVVQNYINFWKSIQNNYHAVNDAVEVVVYSGFVDTVIDALVPDVSSPFEIDFSFNANRKLWFLPVGGQKQDVTKFIRELRHNFGKTGKDLVMDNIRNIDKNFDPKVKGRKNLAGFKDAIKTELKAVADGTQASMQEWLDVVFGKTNDTHAQGNETHVKETATFKLAQGGAYLGPVPTREELATQIIDDLKGWVINNVMRTMGWQMEAIKLDVQGAADRKQQCLDHRGIPSVAGHDCVLLRGNNLDDTDGPLIWVEGSVNFDDANRPKSPWVIGDKFNMTAAFENAVACQNDRATTHPGEWPSCFFDVAVTIRE